MIYKWYVFQNESYYTLELKISFFFHENDKTLYMPMFAILKN